MNCTCKCGCRVAVLHGMALALCDTCRLCYAWGGTDHGLPNSEPAPLPPLEKPEHDVVATPQQLEEMINESGLV